LWAVDGGVCFLLTHTVGQSFALWVFLDISDSFFLWLAEGFGVEISPFVLRLFIFLGGDSILVCPGVVADARHLPGDFESGGAAGDGELALEDFGRDIDRGVPTDGGELVAEVLVEGVEVGRECDECLAELIEDDDAVVDIFHVWGFDE